jgi:hypothetical protein
MLFELDYFPRDNSHDQSSKLFKQNQQLDFYVQNAKENIPCALVVLTDFDYFI